MHKQSILLPSFLIEGQGVRLFFGVCWQYART